MLEAFAHDATLAMDADSDLRAPGGAVTTALCGHWEHEPPCPLAPHHTEPDRVAEVRSRIDAALAAGHQRGPDGTNTRWVLVTSGPGVVRPDEAAQAGRLRDG